jgi:hypothetical protein
MISKAAFDDGEEAETRPTLVGQEDCKNQTCVAQRERLAEERQNE